MATIKDSLKKVVAAAKKTAVVSEEGLKRMRINAERAREAAKTQKK